MNTILGDIDSDAVVPLNYDDNDNDDDLVKILLLNNMSVDSGNGDHFKNTSKIKNELIDNSETSIKDQISILPNNCQNEDNSMNCSINDYNDMLYLNKQTIASLMNLKRLLNLALQKCERKLTTIEKSLQKHTVADTKVLICNAGMPYFKDRHYFFASNNEDEIFKKRNKELQLRDLPKVSSWTRKNRDTLLQAIQSTMLDNVMYKLGNKFEEKRKPETQFPSTDILEVISPLQEKKIDWLKISSTHFEDVHSSLDCCVMWNVFLNPKINKNCWTRSEDKKLKEIVKKYKFQNWEKIAQELSTNRSAYQCFIRYNTTKLLPKRNCSWKTEEDERLLKLIEIFKIGDFIPWGEIARWMQNRTKQQIYFRWTYSLAPYLIKGRFTKVEDSILKDAVIKYGTNYRKISAVLMPNRSTVQLHDRYQTLITNQIENWNLWTLEEDTKLLTLFEKIGPNWSMMAKEFSCKTRTQLRHRHAALHRHIKKGDSLFNLHKNRIKIENKTKEQQKFGEHMFKFNTNITKKNHGNDIEKELIEYFHKKYKSEKFIYKSKLSSTEKLKRNTISLYNILQILNVKISIPNDINNIKLNDQDQQLLYSLREYMRMKNDKKRHFAIIDEYKSRMFNTNDAKKDSYFVSPPPFDSQLKLKKSKESECIDYNLNVRNNFLLEQPVIFDTPDFVTSYIGGNEQELQFRKFSYLLQVNNSKYEQDLNAQNCITSSTKMQYEHINDDNRNNSSNKMLKRSKSIVHSDISTTSLENNDNSQYSKLQSKCYKKLCVPTIKQQDMLCNNYVEISSSSTSGTETPQKHDIHSLDATHATLLSLKNLLYLKRLNERYSVSHQVYIRTPNSKFQKAFNLLESRLELLFKYPIGLSKIGLPEIYVMDTFLYNDIKPKRKSSEIPNTLEKHKTKKLLTLSENSS